MDFGRKGLNRGHLVFGGMWAAALVAMAFIYIAQRDANGAESAVRTAGRAPVRVPSDKAPPRQRAALPVRPPEPGPPRMFRNDRRHTGRSPYRGPARNAVAWKFRTGGRISAQPVVAPNGTIYVGSHDHFFYALGPDGSLRWKRDLGERVYATALVDDAGNVYVGSDADFFWSFAPDGTLRWKLSTEGDADTGAARAANGRIHFAAGNDVYAIEQDGVVRWRFRAPGKVYATPAIDDDGTIYVGAQDDRVYAIAPDGRLRWSHATRSDNDSSPVIGDDGTLYFGSDDHRVHAITRDGVARWSTDLDGYVRAPLALGLDGSVLAAVFGPRPRIVALDAATGAARWYFPVTVADSAEIGIASGPLVDRDGNIYVGAHDDFVYALTARGELRWVLETDGDVDSSPVLAPDGTLYLGSDDGYLYAVR